MIKFCPGCGKDRPVEEFWSHSGKKDGLQSRCIECNGTMRRVDRGLPADNETMRTSCWGLEKTEGYIKVKVKCWSAREGCPGERDFIIAAGDKTPRYVCSSCNESGYERGGRKAGTNTLGRGHTTVPKNYRTEGVILLTPRSKGFAAIVKTITPISQIKGGSQKMPFKAWK